MRVLKYIHIIKYFVAIKKTELTLASKDETLWHKSNKICVRAIRVKPQKSEEIDHRRINKLIDIPCLLIGKLHSVKMSVLPNLVHRCNAILVKIPASYSVDIHRFFLEFIWREKRPRKMNLILKRRTKLENWHYLISKFIMKLL